MTRSTRQTTWCAGTHEQRLRVKGSHVTTLPHRTGFTLVELLVVIGIIAVLAALIVPAVFQARVSTRNAAIKAEIDMLHMAIMNYKNEFGSFPPGKSNTHPTNGDKILRSHMERIFPRADFYPYANQNNATIADRNKDQFFVNYGGDGLDNDGDGQTDEGDGSEVSGYMDIGFNSAIEFFLNGYTSNPASPMKPLKNRKTLFDFDEKRINKLYGEYYPTGKPESPYIYIPSSQYEAAGSIAEIDPTTSTYYNPDTFQILCAGQDEIWGPTSVDDLSNFRKGTREDQ